MSNSDVKRILRKSKLSGKEAAQLIIRDAWEKQNTGKGFLSSTEIELIRGRIKPGQQEIYNDYMKLYEAAWYAVVDASLLGLRIAAACGKLYPPVIGYYSESMMRRMRSRLPQVVTAKEYEERRLAQREYKLLEPIALGYVVAWYMPQDELASERLLQEADAFEEALPEDEGGYHGLLDYVLGEKKEPELARPWLERLLEMLRGGRIEPVHYTEEASERAHGYLPSNVDYASIYEEQSKRPGVRDKAALIEAIERYLAGELEPDELDTRLWNTFITGPELYEAGLEKYSEHIDNYEPMSPEWPLLAILQDENTLESMYLINPETGQYRKDREDRELSAVTLYESYRTIYEDTYEGGLEAYLTDTMEALTNRLEELAAFRLGLQAAAKVLGIELQNSPWDHVEAAYEAIKHLNALIRIASLKDLAINDMERMDMLRGLASYGMEPLIPIEEIDISSLKPAERVVELIQNKMGKLLPAGWAEEELGPVAEETEEDAHEPA